MPWDWKYPEGMTLDDLREFVRQCGDADGDRKVIVTTRWGEEVKDMHIR